MSISFETLALAKRYTRSAVAEAMGGVSKIDFRFVTSLPLAGETGVIYCVSKNGSEPDLYDEYYYVNGRFERIPGATIDLTPYATKDWINGEGYYKKPANGIPETDLDDALKASIAKAETALQQHQSLAAYRTATQQDEHDAAYIEKLEGIEAYAQANVDEIVVGNTQPVDPNVKLWMYQNPGQKIEIPTMEDFRNLKPATDEQVSAAVSDWLEENISGGETIAVDKSLTVEGAAADAKAVGELKSAFDDITDKQISYFDDTNSNGWFTVEDGAYTTGNTVQHLANYHLYQLIAPKTFTFNCSGTVTDSGHLYICVFDGEIKASKRIARYANDGAGGAPALPLTDVTVQAGYIFTISYYSTSASPKYFKIPTNYEVSYFLKDVLKTKPITIEKKSSALFNVYCANDNGSVCKYDFQRKTKTWDSLDYIDEHGVTQQATNVLSSDIWNNYYVANVDTGEQIAQGNNNFIVMCVGDNYHVGSAHGNEVNLDFTLVADGEVVDFSTLATMDCYNLKIISKSYMYALGGGTGNNYDATYPKLDTNGEPIINFVHSMEMNFARNNIITIRNKLLVKQSGIQFKQCHGAMLQCDFGDFRTLLCNNGEESSNTVASDGTVTLNNGTTVDLTNASEKCNIVEMYGDDFYIKQTMLSDNPLTVDKATVKFYFYDDRVKAYFEPVYVEFTLPSGETIDTFNTGDIISVTDTREVVLPTPSIS